MLSIRFSGADLGRIRLAAEPDVMWETALSLHQLVSPDPFFGPWSRLARRALARAGLGRDLHLLTELVPPSSYFPDFLTPPGHSTCLETGIDTALSTGKERLRDEITRLAPGVEGRRPVRFEGIAAGRPAALRHLGGALRRYHAATLAPYAPAVAALAQGDAARHARRVLQRGSEALLCGLGPQLRWRPPVLEVDYPVFRRLDLAGRGLLLVPSFFCHNHPIALADPELTPVLVFPVVRGPLWIPRAAATPGQTATPGGAGLDTLVGPTRAAALRLLDTGHSTSELAARLCTSVSAASRHASALRGAGLVATERLGTSVRHTRTALGTSLVHGG
ncbi:helix-turn-helix domain-containing protein [Streptomyces sp. SKN60]|uniref:ArsR/SmtB family transcription factor n=1 Tax=Streptomyces sp. SKN60 TaxID=2855506 RepID=UPI0022452556|nr:helix-turn-helix domain-containing protein [Streptomyces sp. SKN60]MCX2185526.1 helix-turn-helix domain-containing protein [Streptomyces sp. SKN60]